MRHDAGPRAVRDCLPGECRNRWCKWHDATQASRCGSLACNERGLPPEEYCVDYRAREMCDLLYEVAVAAAVADDPRLHYYELQIDRATVDRIRELFHG